LLVVAGVVLAMLLAIFAAFTLGLWRGRQWVRITYIVINLLGMFVGVPQMWIALKAAPLAGAVQVSRDLMAVASVGLLLTPAAADWFRRRPR
jgi:hypothetical protein